MDCSAARLKELEERFVAWAHGQPEIRAAIVVGSRARHDHPADEWSDLDLMIWASEPEPFLANTDWVAQIGPACLLVPSRTAGNEREILALFEGGYNVDLVFHPYDNLRWLAENHVVPDVFRRGSRAILDKDGLAVQLVPPTCEAPPPQPPASPEEFGRIVAAFWYTAFYVAKQLRRGEMWMAKVRDGNLKEMLLWMMEQHARAVRGQRDTWHLGRFIAEWADPRAAQELDSAFAHYDAPDTWQALLATMGLFRWLAVETAEHLGYLYPTTADAHVTELVKALQAGAAAGPGGHE